MNKSITHKFIGAALLMIMSIGTSFAQDDKPFQGNIYNKDYKVFIRFNLYEDKITIPGQEVFGEMPGYLKADDDGRCWLITDSKIAEDNKSATLYITNDYGSEDLEATLTLTTDSTFTLKQGEGSTIKLARNRKWVKLPKTLEFKKR